jgi:hypothetical protein
MRVRIWLLREFSRFFDAEGLRLMQAFFHITEPERRREVIAFAEKRARQSGQRAHATPLPQDMNGRNSIRRNGGF